MKSCVSSLYEPTCEGEGACAFYGLPHLICVPVPSYADGRPARAERQAPVAHDDRSCRSEPMLALAE